MELQVFRGNPVMRILKESAEAVAAVTRSGDKARVIAIGEAESREAGNRHPNAEIVRPFEHPRTLIGRTEAFDIVRVFLRRHVRRFPLRPIVLMHQLDKLDGGLSPIEMRALKELGEEALGGQVLVVSREEPPPIELFHALREGTL